jgi:hypothetical protein
VHLAQHRPGPTIVTELAYNLDFAEPELSPRQPSEVDPELERARDFITHELAKIRRIEDDMAGRAVMVTGMHHYCGYRGVVQSSHVHLQQCAVRLEATGQVTMIDRSFLKRLP